MKIIKLICLLFLIFGIVKMSDQSAYADSPCMNACGSAYTSCQQNANDALQTCVDQASFTDFNSCADTIMNQYPNMIDYIGWYCQSYQGPYWGGEANAACYSTYNNAMDSCSTAYNGCVSTCPPQ